MIQRIQTIFLFLAALVMGLQAFLPVLSTSIIQAQGIYQDGLLYIREDMLSLILLILAAAVALISIFIFRNLNLQKKLILASLVVLICSIITEVVAFAPPTMEVQKQMAAISPRAASFSPVIALILLILAYRNVTKDQNIIKSMDRLR